MKRTIYKCIVGSQAYGTAIPTSDIDYKGIYIQSHDDVLSFRYKEQVDVGKDECYYEIRRFLELAQSANPTILEMLFMPDSAVLIGSPEFELLRRHKEMFLTKKCAMSFGGYAVAQIRKAKGLNKKMNWELSKVERKTPLDFCYVYEEGKTLPILKWLKREEKKQELCGLVALDHFKDCYALFYDYQAQYGGDSNRVIEPLGFKGIVLDDSNTVRVSSVPKYMTPAAVINYNKDGYSSHCKDYKEYQTWLENRNTQRYVDLKGHDQKIDGKNLLHCRRLLDMAIEIATDKTIRVLRPNADYLLQIRRGEVSLDAIIEQAEKDIDRLEEVYAGSDLPKSVDMDQVNDLLLKIRYLSEKK